MTPDWDDVLDQLELAILDGAAFDPPAGTVPPEYAQRLHSLLELCSEQVMSVKTDLAATRAEVSRLAAARSRTQANRDRHDTMSFTTAL